MTGVGKAVKHPSWPHHCYAGSRNWLQWRGRRVVNWWCPWHPIRRVRDWAVR